MKPNIIQVAYIHHSGFFVKADNKLLIFDYFSDHADNEQRDKNIRFVSDAVHDTLVEQVFIFVSHGHRDHFDPDVFAFNNLGKKTRYILSSDVEVDKPLENCYFIDPYKEMQIDDVQIKTYGSTDEGVSFLASFNGCTVFHAGDLNWWHWQDESTPAELAEYERSFKEVISKMEGENIDVAFFPVDPRLQEYGHIGGAYFLDKLKPQAFFPMHFWDNFDFTQIFSKKMQGDHAESKIYTIDHVRQRFDLEF